MIRLRIFLHKLFGKPEDYQNRTNYMTIVETLNKLYKPKDKLLVDVMGEDHLNLFLFDGLMTNKNEAMKLFTNRVYRRSCQFSDRKRNSKSIFDELVLCIYYRMKHLNSTKKVVTSSNKTVKIDLPQNRKRFLYNNTNNQLMQPQPIMQQNNVPVNYQQFAPAPQMMYYNPQQQQQQNMQANAKNNGQMYQNQPMYFAPQPMMFAPPTNQTSKDRVNAYDIYNELDSKKRQDYFKSFDGEEKEEKQKEVKAAEDEEL